MAKDEKAEASHASPGLAALLFIEACGFVELFDVDERRALDLLGTYRSCAEPIIAEHGGELVDATGSELLAAFSSAVAATQCAMHLGLALRLELRRAPELGIRAGLHVGEIWRDDKRVYGNGVNVAARVMQAAPPGAAYLSEDIFRQIETKLDLRIRPVPPLPMKNIARSLLLYEADWGDGFIGAAMTEARDLKAGSQRDDFNDADPADGAGAAEAGFQPGRGASSSEERIRLASERLSWAVEARVAEALSRRELIVRRRGDRGTGAGGMRAGVEAPPKPSLAPPPLPRLSLEARRERASAQLSAAIRGLIMKAGLGAVFGYAFYASDKPIYLVGLTVLGLFPAISSLRKAMRIGDELKAIAREERSADRDKAPANRPMRRPPPPR